MGNFTYVSFKKNVSDEMFNAMLQEIADNVAPGTMEVKDCAIYLKPELTGSEWACSRQFHRYGARKFGAKYPHYGYSGYWFDHLVLAELSQRFKGILTDDGAPGKFIVERKYQTFEEFLRIFLNPFRAENTEEENKTRDELITQIIKEEVRDWPKAWFRPYEKPEKVNDTTQGKTPCEGQGTV